MDIVVLPILGKVVAAISTNKDYEGSKSSDVDAIRELRFACEDGSRYIMFHSQDCCEDVYLDDICGSLDDLIGSPLLMAEVCSNKADPAKCEYHDSHTWTFYKFGTIKGYVTLRWYGTSNGYYSENVIFEEVK